MKSTIPKKKFKNSVAKVSKPVLPKNFKYLFKLINFFDTANSFGPLKNGSDKPSSCRHLFNNQKLILSGLKHPVEVTS